MTKSFSDCFSISVKLPSPLQSWSFFAVFDGHGGPQTAWMASSQLIGFVLRQPEIKRLESDENYDAEAIKSALK